MQTPPTFSGAARRSTGSGTFVAALCIAALFTLQGCRPDEQDRVKFYEPGVYKGEQDEALQNDTLNDLSRRAMEQQSP